jgi:hypothetical protein
MTASNGLPVRNRGRQRSDTRRAARGRQPKPRASALRGLEEPLGGAGSEPGGVTASIVDTVDLTCLGETVKSKIVGMRTDRDGGVRQFSEIFSSVDKTFRVMLRIVDASGVCDEIDAVLKPRRGPNPNFRARGLLALMLTAIAIHESAQFIHMGTVLNKLDRRLKYELGFFKVRDGNVENIRFDSLWQRVVKLRTALDHDEPTALEEPERYRCRDEEAYVSTFK